MDPPIGGHTVPHLDRHSLAFGILVGALAWLSGVLALCGCTGLALTTSVVSGCAGAYWARIFSRRLSRIASILDTESSSLDAVERAARMLLRAEYDARTRANAVEVAQASERRAHEEALANTVHELRTPLTTIVATLEMVQHGMLDDPVDRGELLSQADAACHHLSFLVNDLLDASAIAVGRLRLDFADFEVEGVVEEALRILNPTAQIRGIDLEVEKDGDAWSRCVHADRMRTLQILFNLAGNAIKYSEDHTSVRVRVRVDEIARTVRFEVHDQGVGVTPEMRGELFGRFARVHRTEDSHASGSGVGLHFSKTMVDQMHGEIGYRERTDEPGSVFWFALPLAEDSASSLPTSSVAAGK